jgi:hypothetical protein
VLAFEPAETGRAYRGRVDQRRKLRPVQPRCRAWPDPPVLNEERARTPRDRVESGETYRMLTHTTAQL